MQHRLSTCIDHSFTISYDVFSTLSHIATKPLLVHSNVAAGHTCNDAACNSGAFTPLVQHGDATMGSCHAVRMAQHFCEMYMSIYNDMLLVPMSTVADHIVCLQATAKVLAFHLGKPFDLAACRLGTCSSDNEKQFEKNCTT